MGVKPQQALVLFFRPMRPPSIPHFCRQSLFGILFFLIGAGSLPASSPHPEGTERIDSLLRSACLRGARIGIRVASLKDGRLLYDHRGMEPLAPASNMKILTAAAALHILGPAYRYSTTFHTESAIDEGILKGPLYLKGWGAPDLVGESWWWMARELRRLGLEQVEGDLVLDDTHFDGKRRPPGWPRPVVDRAYNAPVSALSCNYNVVTVRVVPGKAVGEKPGVHLIPFRSHLVVKNQAVTRKGRSRISIVRVGGKAGEQILVRGSIPPGGRSIESILSIDNPTWYAGHAFREAAEEVGIRFQGKIRAGVVPSGSIELYRYESKPLAVILRAMNKFSNNFIAEMVVKSLDAAAGHIPGTTKGGLKILHDTLVEAGVDLDHFQAVDGSGLAEGNLSTPATIVSTLLRFGTDFRTFPELLASLPVAGVDGTLEDRDAAGNLTGRIRAKTGRLNGVDAFSGYAEGPDGEVRVFSILVNGARCDHERVSPILDRIGGEIARLE